MMPPTEVRRSLHLWVARETWFFPETGLPPHTIQGSPVSGIRASRKLISGVLHSRKLSRHTKEPGLLDSGSLLSGYAGGFSVAPPPLSQRSCRTNAGPLVYFLTVIYASTHVPNPCPEHGATPPLWLRFRSECPDDKGLRHREACLPDGTRSVRGGL